MVTVRDLNHSFGDKQVLSDISFEVNDGEVLAIMGSSGGGKTTLLRCISGLIVPTSGTVEVGGIDVRKKPVEARRQMGMVFQASALFDYLNVEENVLFGVRRWLKLSRADQRKLVSDTLGMVGLKGSERQMPAELSGGMQKRVGIARALALKPKVMLYDEPTTGLDPITSFTIDALIAEVREQLKMTSLIVSHDVSSVFRVADRIAFLDHGRLTFLGQPSEFESSRDAAIRELIEKALARKLELESRR